MEGLLNLLHASYQTHAIGLLNLLHASYQTHAIVTTWSASADLLKGSSSPTSVRFSYNPGELGLYYLSQQIYRTRN
jgi:hypothetical protein